MVTLFLPLLLTLIVPFTVPLIVHTLMLADFETGSIAHKDTQLETDVIT